MHMRKADGVSSGMKYRKGPHAERNQKGERRHRRGEEKSRRKYRAEINAGDDREWVVRRGMGKRNTRGRGGRGAGADPDPGYSRREGSRTPEAKMGITRGEAVEGYSEEKPFVRIEEMGGTISARYQIRAIPSRRDRTGVFGGSSKDSDRKTWPIHRKSEWG